MVYREGGGMRYGIERTVSDIIYSNGRVCTDERTSSESIRKNTI